jgi:hypothetical protein
MLLHTVDVQDGHSVLLPPAEMLLHTVDVQDGHSVLLPPAEMFTLVLKVIPHTAAVHILQHTTQALSLGAVILMKEISPAPSFTGWRFCWQGTLLDLFARPSSGWWSSSSWLVFYVAEVSVLGVGDFMADSLLEIVTQLANFFFLFVNVRVSRQATVRLSVA